MSLKPIKLRLPKEVYSGVHALAEEAGSTMNACIAEILQERLKKHQEEALWKSFIMAGSNEQESKVDFAFEAQSEVVLSDD